MALISNDGYCRIAHVTVDPATFSGSVRVEVFPSEQAFYEMGESPVQQTYPVQWLRNANYVLDAYLYLMTLADFAGMGMDDEVLPDSGGTLSVEPRPTIHHKIVDGVWIADLVSIKDQARAGITAARNNEERNGFMAYGKLFDSDTTAIQRISVAAQAAQSIGSVFTIEWTCADNSVIALDYDQMINLPLIMAQAANTLHIKARDLKAQIELANSIEELNLITW